MEIDKYIIDAKNYIYKHINNKEDANDILQDAILYCLCNANKYTITNDKGFLLNSCNFFIKKYYNSIKTYDYLTDIEDQPASLEYDDLILRTIQSISKKELQPYFLQLEGYSIRDIAQVYNLPINSIKTKIRRCKIKLYNNRIKIEKGL